MLILTCLVLSVGFVVAQTTKASGVVLDDTGETVPGASVVVKGTTVGTATDVDGKFSLNVPEGKNTLVISFIGLRTQEVKAGVDLRIKLEADESTMLDDVMVVAYGTTDKKSFTGSASVIKPDQITKRNASNVSKAIDGLVSGVTVTSGSGQPGAGSSIIIRGYGSINASNDPLYVVDGAPYDGTISAINPNDIESMTVLKDASASALYGARGSNGVIIITTKSGKKGETTVNLKANWGVGSRAVPRYKTVDERGYLETVFQSYKNEQIAAGLSPQNAGIAALNNMKQGSAPILGENEQYNPFNYSITELIDPVTGKVRSDAVLRYSDDWIDESSADSPLRQEYVLDVTGGSDKTSYLFSFGYLNEKGLLKTTSFERYTGRMKIDSDVKEWFKVGLGSNMALNKSNTLEATGSANSNVFYSGMLMAPIFPVYQRDADGNILYNTDGSVAYDYGKNRPAGAQQDFNSVATLFDDKYQTKRDVVSGRGYFVLGNLKEGPLEGLALNVNLNMDMTNSDRSRYYNPYNGNAATVKGMLKKENARTLSFTLNQLLTWKRKFDRHNIDVLAGHEFYSYRYNYRTMTKSGFPFGGLTELAAGTTISDANSYKDTYRIESWLSRFNYNYDDRYYLSLSARRDGSSVLSPDDRWGAFWSVGGNWRISQEKFLSDVKWLDNLALKASYGLQGNDNINASPTRTDLDYLNRNLYAWQGLYDLGYPNGTASGALLSQLQNTDLKWERSQNLNIGFDAQLFNRLSVAVEYYNKKTIDLILEYPMPVSSGFTSYSKNIGSMRNQGFEITLGGDVVRAKDFTWNMTLMGNTISNKVLELTDKKDNIISGRYIIQKGEPVNSFYLSKSAGVDPATGDQLYYVWDTDEAGNKTNYRISSSLSDATNSKEIVGNRFPDLYGSINNLFRYKDFDFSILCTYSIGGKIYDGVYNTLMTSSYVGQTRHENILRAWKNPGDITDIPKVSFGTTRAATDADLVSASYFSIKNIVLGYTIPSSFLRKVDLKSVRVNVTADNLLLLSELKGMDPQYNFTGGTSFVYSPVRTISLGLDIKF